MNPLAQLADALRQRGLNASVEDTGGGVPAVVTYAPDGREIYAGNDDGWYYSVVAPDGGATVPDVSHTDVGSAADYVTSQVTQANPRDLAAEQQQSQMGMAGQVTAPSDVNRWNQLYDVDLRESDAARKKLARLDERRGRYETFTPQAAPTSTLVTLSTGVVTPSASPTALPAVGRTLAARTFPGGLQYPRPLPQTPHQRFQIGRHVIEQIPDPVERMYTGTEEYRVSVKTPTHRPGRDIPGSLGGHDLIRTARGLQGSTSSEHEIGTSATYRGALTLAERQAPGRGRPSKQPKLPGVAQTGFDLNAPAVPLGNELRILPAYARKQERAQEAAYHSRSAAGVPSAPIPLGQMSLFNPGPISGLHGLALAAVIGILLWGACTTD